MTDREREKHVQSCMEEYNVILGEIISTYHQITYKIGLSNSAMKILYIASAYEEGCPMQTLVKQTGISKQTISSSLKNLECEGIVSLEAVDGKSKKVILTEKGRALAAESAYRMKKIETDILLSWSDQEIGTYLELTKRYMEALQTALEGEE